jgi:hypothetical protein
MKKKKQIRNKQSVSFAVKKAFLSYTITDFNFEIDFLKDLFTKTIRK